jgi:hypothetical protein
MSLGRSSQLRLSHDADVIELSDYEGLLEVVFTKLNNLQSVQYIKGYSKIDKYCNAQYL